MSRPPRHFHWPAAQLKDCDSEQEPIYERFNGAIAWKPRQSVPLAQASGPQIKRKL